MGGVLVCIAAAPLVHDRLDNIFGNCEQAYCEQVSFNAFITVGIAFVNDSTGAAAAYPSDREFDFHAGCPCGYSFTASRKEGEWAIYLS